MAFSSGKTALYRAYDHDGQLLYVGISQCAFSRLDQHRRSSGWFGLLENLRVTWFETREQAERSERTAIRDEKPIFNVITFKNDVGDREYGFANSLRIALLREGRRSTGYIGIQELCKAFGCSEECLFKYSGFPEPLFCFEGHAFFEINEIRSWAYLHDLGLAIDVDSDDGEWISRPDSFARPQP